MRTPVQAEAPRRRRRRAVAVLLVALCAATAFVPAAWAAPLTLASDSDFAAFADRLRAFADASRVRWVVATKTRADAEAAVALIANRLAPSDRPLIGRIEARALADAAPKLADSASPLTWMIAAGDSGAANRPACSWQVAVSDPGLPTVGDGPLVVSLAPNDRLPVGAAATFRIGYAGLLQSRLYAFGETEPGAIRDLAISPDVNIPVAENGVETILLAISRQPAPYLERIRAALASSAGQRRELGRDYALRGALLGPGRGIGANIQVVGPNMVMAKDDKAAAPARPELDPGELAETCQFSLMAAAKATQ